MYTATKTGKGFSAGQAWVQVQYTDDAGAPKFEEVYRAATIRPDWPDAQIRAKLAEVNALDLAAIELGDVKPKPADPAPIPPTQDQLDEQAFLLLLRDWREKRDALGISKTVTQQNVDDAYAAMKTAFKEEYAPFLAGAI